MARRKKTNATAEKATQNRHQQPRESFHLPGALREALNEYVNGMEPAPAKSAVIRVALEKFLRDKGFWPRNPSDSDD